MRWMSWREPVHYVVDDVPPRHSPCHSSRPAEVSASVTRMCRNVTGEEGAAEAGAAEGEGGGAPEAAGDAGEAAEARAATVKTEAAEEAAEVEEVEEKEEAAEAAAVEEEEEEVGEDLNGPRAGNPRMYALHSARHRSSPLRALHAGRGTGSTNSVMSATIAANSTTSGEPLAHPYCRARQILLATSYSHSRFNLRGAMAGVARIVVGCNLTQGTRA